DQRGDDRWHGANGARPGRRGGSDGTVGSGRHWRVGLRHRGDLDRVAVRVFLGAGLGQRNVAVDGSRRPGQRIPNISWITVTTPKTLRPRRMPALISVLLVVGTIACRGGGSAPAGTAVTPAAGPMTIDVVRVVEQALDVQLSLPGERTPYQSVAIYSRVIAVRMRMHVG